MTRIVKYVRERVMRGARTFMVKVKAHHTEENLSMNELTPTQVLESKRNAIRKGLVYELLNAQDTVLCSCFAQRSGVRRDCQNLGGTADEVFQGLDNFE
jgi:hypothetical protein